MKKTIKELADELGVKKHIIKYQVEKIPKEYVENNSGVIFIKDKGIALIKINIGADKSEEKLNYSADNGGENYLVKHLLKEVDEKNNQIKEFQKMIETQQKLLDQQQVLTLQANKKIAELETILTESDLLKEEDQAESEIPKKSFWSKLFG